MLSKVLRPTNKQVSKIKDQRMHLRSVNNTRINSISPSNKIEDGFDFIKTCNIPFSPNQSIKSNPRRNKIDVKIRFKNDRLRSADISLDENNNYEPSFQTSDDFSKTTKNPFTTNMHLLAENKEIKERNQELLKKIEVIESKLNDAHQTNILQETLLKNWYTPHDKITDSMKKTLKTFWFRRYTQQIADLKVKHMSTIYKLKLSYAKQVEDLQEMVGHMTNSFNELANQKSDHGTKFVEIIKKYKEKYQKMKTENKYLTKKIEMSEVYCKELKDKLYSTEIQNTKFRKIIEELRTSNSNLDARNKELVKKLYKFKSDHSTVDLDPFEMHQ